MSITYLRALDALKTSLSVVIDGRVAAEDIEAETRLFEPSPSSEIICLEIDSLGALDAITLVEQSLGVHLPDDVDFSELMTVGDVANLIVKQT
jgi:acyl carrier protein